MMLSFGFRYIVTVVTRVSVSFDVLSILLCGLIYPNLFRMIPKFLENDQFIALVAKTTTNITI
jgi:hypothetical protein